jgi:hypothetical protein
MTKDLALAVHGGKLQRSQWLNTNEFFDKVRGGQTQNEARADAARAQINHNLKAKMKL